MSDLPLVKMIAFFLEKKKVATFMSVHTGQSFHTVTLRKEGMVESIQEMAQAGLTINGELLYIAGMVGILALPGSLIMIASRGWPRWTLIGLSCALLTCVILICMGDQGLLAGQLMSPVLSVWTILLLVSIFGGQAIASAQPKR